MGDESRNPIQDGKNSEIFLEEEPEFRLVPAWVAPPGPLHCLMELGAPLPPPLSTNLALRTIVCTVPLDVMKACGFALAAVLCFWFGIEKHDKSIYLPCVGWMVLDSAVITGVVIYGQVR
jgi:hypothetical protein